MPAGATSHRSLPTFACARALALARSRYTSHRYTSQRGELRLSACYAMLSLLPLALALLPLALKLALSLSLCMLCATHKRFAGQLHKRDQVHVRHRRLHAVVAQHRRSGVSCPVAAGLPLRWQRSPLLQVQMHNQHLSKNKQPPFKLRSTGDIKLPWQVGHDRMKYLRNTRAAERSRSQGPFGAAWAWARSTKKSPSA